MRVLLLDRAVGNPYSRGLAQGLTQAGVSVRLAGPAQCPSEGILAVFPRSGVVGHRCRKLLDLIAGAARFLRAMVSFQPHVLHVHWEQPLDVLYAWLGWLSGARIVYTAHNPGPRSAGLSGVLLRRLAAAIIVHGPRLRTLLVDRFPELDGCVHVVEHGNYEHTVRRLEPSLARATLCISDDTRVFTFLGQLGPRKGIESLLEAYARYRHSRRDGVLLLVGTASSERYLGQLQTISDRLGVSPLLMTGLDYLPQEKLDIAASAATAVVLPFPDATQSGSVIFAMTHGRCVITTFVGEVERTVRGRGILVPPSDVEALANALCRAHDDPSSCQLLGRYAREYALRDLSWRRIGMVTRSVYETARKDGPSARSGRGSRDEGSASPSPADVAARERGGPP